MTISPVSDLTLRRSGVGHHELERLAGVARSAAAAGAEVLRRRFGDLGRIREKGRPGDLVTEVDLAAEQAVLAVLEAETPELGVLAEEAGRRNAGQTGLEWCVDPLDGTTNYAHRVPWYSVSIGLELDDVPLVGVVHAPEMGWDFWAVRGGGAFLGDQPLRVSETADLDRSLVATGFPYDRRTAEDNNVPELAAVIRRCQGVRRIGVASLDCALVARGCLDAYWEPKLKPWDISAGALLVLEAGGRVSLPDGSPYRSTVGHILASNGRVHDELVAVLASVRSPQTA